MLQEAFGDLPLDRLLQTQVGRPAKVLVERAGHGHTEAFAPFRFSGDLPPAGRVVAGVGERVEAGTLIGRALP